LQNKQEKFCSSQQNHIEEIQRLLKKEWKKTPFARHTQREGCAWLTPVNHKGGYIDAMATFGWLNDDRLRASTEALPSYFTPSHINSQGSLFFTSLSWTKGSHAHATSKFWTFHVDDLRPLKSTHMSPFVFSYMVVVDAGVAVFISHVFPAASTITSTAVVTITS